MICLVMLCCQLPLAPLREGEQLFIEITAPVGAVSGFRDVDSISQTKGTQKVGPITLVPPATSDTVSKSCQFLQARQ